MRIEGQVRDGAFDRDALLIAQSPDLRLYDKHVYLQPQDEELNAYIASNDIEAGRRTTPVAGTAIRSA